MSSIFAMMLGTLPARLYSSACVFYRLVALLEFDLLCLLATGLIGRLSAWSRLQRGITLRHLSSDARIRLESLARRHVALELKTDMTCWAFRTSLKLTRLRMFSSARSRKSTSLVLSSEIMSNTFLDLIDATSEGFRSNCNCFVSSF